MKGGSVMERRSQFSQKQKLDILESAKDVGWNSLLDGISVAAQVKCFGRGGIFSILAKIPWPLNQGIEIN